MTLAESKTSARCSRVVLLKCQNASCWGLTPRLIRSYQSLRARARKCSQNHSSALSMNDLGMNIPCPVSHKHIRRKVEIRQIRSNEFKVIWYIRLKFKCLTECHSPSHWATPLRKFSPKNNLCPYIFTEKICSQSGAKRLQRLVWIFILFPLKIQVPTQKPSSLHNKPRSQGSLCSSVVEDGKERTLGTRLLLHPRAFPTLLVQDGGVAAMD